MFLEGEDDLAVWNVLAFNLRSISASPVPRPLEVPKAAASQLEDSGGIVEGKPLQREWLLLSRGLKEVGKAVWLQRVSEQVLKNSEFLKKCLVRRWGVSTNLLPGLGVLKS